MRWNGSTIGKRDEPDNLAGASGVWSLRSQTIYQKDNQWASVLPTKFPQLSLWLDASDSATLFDATTGGSAVAANGAVARWEDKSGNKLHATQGTANNRPLRKTAQHNGKDALDFDGSDDRFTFGSTTPFQVFAMRSTYSAFVVGIADTVGTNSANPFENEAFWGDESGIVGCYLRSNNTANTWNYDTGSRIASVSYTAGSLAIFGSEFRAGSIRMRLNGGSEVATASTDTFLANLTLNIGRQYNSNNFCLDGQIGEILFYRNALSAAQREAVEGYLAHKWGLSTSLPSAHPYRNVVP